MLQNLRVAIHGQMSTSEPTKICKQCGGEFPYSQLHYKDGKHRTPRALCKSCSKGLDAQAKSLREQNPLPDPHFCIGQCGTWLEQKDMKLHHCHKTGKFIAYLCNNCNIASGLANDDPKVLDALSLINQNI